MWIITWKLAIWGTLGLLLLSPAISSAMDIVPNYDPNITQQQRNIIDQKIALWEQRLCCGIVLNIDFSNDNLGGLLAGPPPAEPGVEYIVGRLPSGEWLTWGETDQCQEDGQGRPTHARIRFNNNPAVNWHYVNPPVPPGAVDFWTVANHEICHAAGFSVNYSRFAAQIGAPNPDGTRPFNCAGVAATLTPATQGTHLDPTGHPGDLMNPFYDPGNPRRAPSPLDIAMLRCIWPCEQGSGEGSTSKYDANDAIEVPTPGNSVVISFTLDTTYPNQQLFVYLAPEFGGGAFAVPANSGSVTMQGTRRAIPGEEDIVDLELLDSYLVGGSINIPYFGETGLNILEYSQLSGTLELNTGHVELVGSGTIVNDLFGHNSPIIVAETIQQGELDINTGELLITTAASDIFPVGIPTISQWGMVILAFLLLAVGTIAVVRIRKAALSKAA